MEPEITPQEPALVVDEQMRYYFNDTTKWARFLAIVGFILTGIMVIFAFSISSIMSSLSTMSNFPMAGGFAITIIYLVLALLYFIPCLFLFRFAQRTRNALAENHQERLASGFDNLNRFFKFVGILTLIYLIIIALAFIAVLVGGMFGAMI